jgi:hypothetical protein
MTAAAASIALAIVMPYIAITKLIAGERDVSPLNASGNDPFNKAERMFVTSRAILLVVRSLEVSSGAPCILSPTAL